MCAESPLFDVLLADNCGGGGGGGCCCCCCDDDDGRINSIGTPVYGDFTTSSYFGGKSFAAINTKQKRFLMDYFSIFDPISFNNEMKKK